MATRAKSINLFLMDGNANGRIKCSIANWTGVAYKIPRTDLQKCQERSELKQSGVYFLFGTSENDDQLVYIGQAGSRKNGKGILLRLQEHDNAKEDYWTEAIVFTTQNNSFGPTEISYLENRFCNLAVEAKRYIVKNSNDPTPGNITEEKECELEEFVDLATMITGTLGHRVFMPLVGKGKDATETIAYPILHFRSVKLVAKGMRTAEGFVLLKGSSVSLTFTKSCPAGTLKRRKKLADLISVDGVTTEDILFSSPSAAASFVGGSSLSGNNMWLDENGDTLGDILSK